MEEVTGDKTMTEKASEALSMQQTEATRRSTVDEIIFMFKKVTLEPCILLNYVATVMQLVVIQALVMKQTCLMSYQHTEEFCTNVTGKELQTQLTRTAANYNLFRQILETAPCFFFAPFLGAWSDKYGTKMLLLLPLIGDTIACLVCAILAWVQFVHPGYLLVASAVQGFTGGNLAFNLGVCSFIIRQTTTASRTARIALLDATFLIAAVIGKLLGGFLYKQYGYVTVFGIAVMLNALAIFYTSLRLIKVPPVNQGSKSQAAGDLFRLQHLINCFAVLLKKREKRRKCYIFIVLLCAVLVNLPRKGERNIFFLYTKTKVGFSVAEFSIYDAFSTGTLIVGTLLVLPTLSYCIQINDIIIVIVAIMASIANDILIAFSYSSLMLYIAAALVLFSASASVICRSILTKCVDKDELGKLLALLGLLEVGVPILSGLLYTQVFNATLNTFPGTCYLMSASLTILPAICFIWIYFQLTKQTVGTSAFQVNET